MSTDAMGHDLSESQGAPLTCRDNFGVGGPPGGAGTSSMGYLAESVPDVALLAGAAGPVPGSHKGSVPATANAQGGVGTPVGGYWQATLEACSAYMPHALLATCPGADKRHVHTREQVLRVCACVRLCVLSFVFVCRLLGHTRAPRSLNQACRACAEIIACARWFSYPSIMQGNALVAGFKTGAGSMCRGAVPAT